MEGGASSMVRIRPLATHDDPRRERCAVEAAGKSLVIIFYFM
jgi:hypothetical protein